MCYIHCTVIDARSACCLPALSLQGLLGFFLAAAVAASPAPQNLKDTKMPSQTCVLKE